MARQKIRPSAKQMDEALTYAEAARRKGCHERTIELWVANWQNDRQGVTQLPLYGWGRTSRVLRSDLDACPPPERTGKACRKRRRPVRSA